MAIHVSLEAGDIEAVGKAFAKRVGQFTLRGNVGGRLDAVILTDPSTLTQRSRTR